MTAVIVLAAMLVPQGGVAASVNGSGSPGGLIIVESAAALVRVSSSGKVLAPRNGAYAGVFKPPAPFGGLGPLSTYKTQTGKSPAIVMWYQPWITASYGQFKTAEVNAILKSGSIPMITWEPWNPGSTPHILAHPTDQPNYRLQRIIDGKYDSYIRSWARAAKAVKGPVMIRPMHEMNGNWYPWSGTVNGNSPAKFVKAWRHVHDIFVREGAKNVTWVWSVNWSCNPNTHANRYAAYYPGSAYVDWTSISGFNWGATRSFSKNLSFTTIYTKPLAYLRTLNKPIVISEMASVSKGVNKPAWIADAYRRIRIYHHEVKGVIYYDKREVGTSGTQDWQLASSAASVKAYRTAIKDSWFFGGAPKTMVAVWH